ncbi:hypothetical protein DEH81_21315 [Pectobacterium zantedeschiae]|nr:hypothetical protein DEH81_21315 [Pectobacterium zantedeschiae]
MRDILSLTGGPPLAGQIRSRRICPAFAARARSINESRPCGPMLCIVQNVNVLSSNSNYLGYMAQVLTQFNNSGFIDEEKRMDEKM